MNAGTFAGRAMKWTFTYPAAILVFFLSCQCTGWMSTNIEDIRNNPRQYADKEVTVYGEVTRTFSLFVVKYFVLRDKTGEITVVTKKPLPKEGQSLKIRGVVREAFSVGSESVLVIVEEPDRAK